MDLQHDNSLMISRAARHTAAAWPAKEIKWSNFVADLVVPARAEVTSKEFNQMAGSGQTDVKASAGAFVGGVLIDNKRKKGNVVSRQLIALDIDDMQKSAKDFIDDIELTFGYAFAIYSTFKHTTKKPRLRVLIPLSRPVTADEYEAVARKLADDYLGGIQLFDATTFEPERLMFYPVVAKDDDEYVFAFDDAAWLIPDDVLKQYDDWTDCMSWPQHANTIKKRQSDIKKQENPLNKKGFIGVFNREYDIHQTIEKFLPDIYEQTSDSNRYTFVEGTTNGGLVVYDDLFAYSHHSTDPCGGLLVNAFDLVRLHKFGELDAEADGKLIGKNLPSFNAMVEFVKKDDAAAMRNISERQNSAIEDFADEFQNKNCDDNIKNKNVCDWKLQLDINKNGDVLPHANNIYAIYKNTIAHCIKYNEFDKVLTVVKPFIWDSARRLAKGGESFTDSDEAAMNLHFQRAYDIDRRKTIEEVRVTVAQHHKFHPVKDAFESLVWDGVPRAETLFIDYLGAQDNVYSREITLKWLLATVSRIYKPGTAFPLLPVLEGEQGLGKSLLVARLTTKPESWFLDSLPKLSDTKAVGELISGKLIVEIGELSALKHADIESTKAFISRNVDSYRTAYSRYAQDHKRQCTFIGTTNESNYLKDRTGNRRFAPIKCSVERRKHIVADDFTTETALLIWAEVLELYKAKKFDGELSILSDEAAPLAEAARKEKMIADPVEIEIADWFANFSGGDRPKELFLSRVISEALGRSDTPNGYERQHIVQIIESLGYKKAISKKTGCALRKQDENNLNKKVQYWVLDGTRQ